MIGNKKRPRAFGNLPARLVAAKIQPQFPATPEGQLMFAVVRQALVDALGAEHDPTATHYLLGSIPHAALCGVDSDWIRSVMRAVARAQAA